MLVHYSENFISYVRDCFMSDSVPDNAPESSSFEPNLLTLFGAIALVVGLFCFMRYCCCRSGFEADDNVEARSRLQECFFRTRRCRQQVQSAEQLLRAEQVHSYGSCENENVLISSGVSSEADEVPHLSVN